MVRAKFTVSMVSAPRKITHWDNEGNSSQVDVVDVSLYPVTGGSNENNAFFASTPGGLIQLQTINLEAAQQFEAGRQFYVDFTEAQ